ncbi:MAG: shikimate dehydrogenase [Anaerolineae bacterium]|nr:shikimate dehydrogenase [Gemmatimonadaceae bacterium]
MNPPGRLVLLGHPVEHSLSPTFQNAALRFRKLFVPYEALDVRPDAFEATINSLVAEHAAGNVTIPYKERMALLCKRLTADARRAAAVNTFWVDDDGILSGDCTDVGGFNALAREVMGEIPRGARVAVLGSGGAAAAVLTALERWEDCTVQLWNRSRERAETLASRFSIATSVASSAEDAARAASVIVNATSIGLLNSDHPVPISALQPSAVVLDLVYRTGETAWVRAARERGLVASDGLLMLVEQGALAFERWFGMPAPRDVMRESVSRLPAAYGHR